jgi:Tfp pilus assembly protein PilO
MASSAGVIVDNIGEAKAVAKSIPNTTSTATNNAEVVANNNVVDSTLENWDTGITLKGNYAQVRTFVKSLEDSLILSDLRDISITQTPSADKNQPSDILAVSMVVRTYVQP